MSEAKVKVTFRDQIKEILEREAKPMTANDIAKILGMSVHRVTGPLSRLAAYGEIEVVQRFKFIHQPTIYKAKG